MIIVTNPAGTLVSGSTNTFDYPILSNVTLTCNVTLSDGSTPMMTNYQWNTTGCFANNFHNTPTCFPTDQTTQSVTGNNLLAKDAGTITCTVTINDESFTSESLTLRISGTAQIIIYLSVHMISCIIYLIQNSQAVKKECGPQKGYGEKRCEIQGGGQEMAVMVG